MCGSVRWEGGSNEARDRGGRGLLFWLCAWLHIDPRPPPPQTSQATSQLKWLRTFIIYTNCTIGWPGALAPPFHPAPDCTGNRHHSGGSQVICIFYCFKTKAASKTTLTISPLFTIANKNKFGTCLIIKSGVVLRSVITDEWPDDATRFARVEGFRNGFIWFAFSMISWTKLARSQGPNAIYLCKCSGWQVPEENDVSDNTWNTVNSCGTCFLRVAAFYNK